MSLNKFIQLFGAAALITVAACAPLKNSDKIAQVESLQKRLDSVEVRLENLPLEEVEVRKTTAKKDLDFLKKATDVLTRDDLFLVDAYNANFKMLKKLEKGYHLSFKELAYSKSQLKNLKSDLYYGNLNDTLFSKYYVQEERAVIQLEKTADKLDEWNETSDRKYRGLKPRIDSLIHDLNRRGIR